MKHCVLELYQDCSNYSPRVKIGPPQGHRFSLYVYSKNCSHPQTLTLIITLKFLMYCRKTLTSNLHKKLTLFCIFLRPGNFTFVYQLDFCTQVSTLEPMAPLFTNVLSIHKRIVFIFYSFVQI
jgi:hypothetical protein